MSMKKKLAFGNCATIKAEWSEGFMLKYLHKIPPSLFWIDWLLLLALGKLIQTNPSFFHLFPHNSLVVLFPSLCFLVISFIKQLVKSHKALEIHLIEVNFLQSKHCVSHTSIIDYGPLSFTTKKSSLGEVPLICPLIIWLVFVLSHDWLLWFIIQSYSEVASRVFIIFVFVNHMQTDQGNYFISWMKMANCGRPLWIFITHENLFHPGSKIIDLAWNK